MTLKRFQLLLTMIMLSGKTASTGWTGRKGIRINVERTGNLIARISNRIKGVRNRSNRIKINSRSNTTKTGGITILIEANSISQGMRRNKWQWIIAVFFFVSCNQNVVFEKNIKIPDYRWSSDNVVKLDADINDTIALHNIYINLRNASGYEFSNLFLFLTTKTPKGETARDTVELPLADATGKWLGNGLGDIYDNRILFKKNFRFPEAGTWHFELEQAMRVNPLPQVMDVGMRIEKSK
jgi:gliding motility-associated lipoprotein GldH